MKLTTERIQINLNRRRFGIRASYRTPKRTEINGGHGALASWRINIRKEGQRVCNGGLQGSIRWHSLCRIGVVATNRTVENVEFSNGRIAATL